MNFEDAEKIVEKAKTQPFKTIFIIFVALGLAALFAYVISLSTEKGTQHATPPTPAQTDQSESAATPDKQTSSEKSTDTVSVEQKTYGNQSPAVVTKGGNVTIINKGSQ